MYVCVCVGGWVGVPVRPLPLFLPPPRTDRPAGWRAGGQAAVATPPCMPGPQDMQNAKCNADSNELLPPVQSVRFFIAGNSFFVSEGFPSARELASSRHSILIVF